MHEFLAIATHPRIYDPPSTLTQALAQMDAWLESPTATLLAETRAYWEVLTAFLRAGRVTGAQVHDARIAALCRHHGVSVLWTADRDFSRFRGLATHNPLIET